MNAHALQMKQSNIIKGFAILLVVLCHLGGYFTRFLTPLGGIGVAVFLILSAYGLEKSFLKSGQAAFWRKRIITVFVPYWIIEIIASVTGLIPIRGGGIRYYLI
ncbi:MAG: acyltransferase family protein [Bacteroides thetaiotaomicron]|nr:acyltransferase family protein [Bacteroides thetaiotaomicron]